MHATDAKLLRAGQLRERNLPRATVGPKHAWTWAHLFAGLGVAIAIVEAWTVGAWLADGPHQVTSIRNRSAISWAAGQWAMVLVTLMAIPATVYLIRESRRQRRILTLELMVFCCGFTLFWTDHLVNFYMPTWVNSANMLNLNSPLGHLPFVVNPSIGEYADAIPFWMMIESFGLVAMIVIMRAVLRRSRSRWPGITLGKQFGLVLLVGAAAEIVLEAGLLVPLGLETFLSPPWMSFGIGRGLRYSSAELVGGALWFALCTALILFKNDRGETLLERGLESTRPRRRRAITFLAFYGALQLITIVPGNWFVIATGPYEEPWPKLPKDLVGNVCDAPGVTNTRYGPCPGEPQFRMPGRTSRLPARQP